MQETTWLVNISWIQQIYQTLLKKHLVNRTDTISNTVACPAGPRKLCISLKILNNKFQSFLNVFTLPTVQWIWGCDRQIRYSQSLKCSDNQKYSTKKIRLCCSLFTTLTRKIWVKNSRQNMEMMGKPFF